VSSLSPRVNVNPRVMNWARETAALSREDVGKLLNIKVNTVQAWEEGDRKPTLNTLNKLAAAYKRPLASFFLPEPPSEPPTPHDFRVLPDEKRHPLSRKTLLAIRRARYIQSIATELLETEETIKKPAISMGKVSIREDPELVAARYRQIFRISLEDQLAFRSPHEAFRNWRDKVENLGIVVHQARIPPEEIRGFSLLDGMTPTIAISLSDAIHAKIFTLLHEYAHILLDISGICIPEEASTKGKERDMDVERFCNHFAGAFLVPREALLNDNDAKAIASHAEIGTPQLSRIASRFKVSRQVVLRRLLICGLISRRQYLEKQQELTSIERPRPRKKDTFKMPASRRCVLENGHFFVSLALDAVAREAITYSDVADYLNVDLNNLDKIQALV
jgi:Zn-dependent peptidase ImmA (M78 family)/DNA-binding XRE family transcriptional regulator